jgi:capsule polysaccharide export protein KpsE/RkpR
MSLFSSAGPAASVGSAALGIKSPGAIFVGILGSRAVQESVVTRFDLVHHYKQHLIEDACKRLTADTVIREDLKSGIITINVKADNPVLASKIAQGYVEELDRVVTNHSTSAARRERIFLDGRLKEIKQDLDDSAKALSQFSTKSRTIDIPSQGKAMVDSGLRLQDQMVAARSELAGLQQSYSKDNVRIRAAHARIAELQRQIDKMMGSTKEPRLNASDSAYPSVSELPALGLTYSDLARRMRVEEVLWDAMTRQYEAARVQEAKEIPTVRVLDVANVPQHKSGPPRGAILMLGAILSLFTMCILVLAASSWEAMDPQDDPKKLVTEILRATLRSQEWPLRLLATSWARVRFRGSKQHL